MKKLISLLLLVSFSVAGDYLNSAHGNNEYGVFRLNLDITPGYNPARGNCAHCHEMHGVINGKVAPPTSATRPNRYALFAPNFNYDKQVGPYSISDDYCFYCHSSESEGSVQISNGINTYVTNNLKGIDNMLYSYTFGVADSYKPSASSISPSLVNVTSILSQFNLASYHNLYDIALLMAKKYPCDTSNNPNYPYYKTFTLPNGDEVTYANPCDGCHNPHLVQRIKGYRQDPASYSVMSMPDEHKKLFKESMEDYINKHSSEVTYTITYQNPRAIDTGFEPAGISIPDPSKMPNYVDFCLKCHYDPNAQTITWGDYEYGTITCKETSIYSHELGRNLFQIDWGKDGDKHGLASASADGTIIYEDLNDNGQPDPGETALLPPYDNPSDPELRYGQFVVSCLDCHEPHGSYNTYLLRIAANNHYLNSDDYITDHFDKYTTIGYGGYCSFCHKADSFYYSGYIVADSNGTTIEATWETWKYIHHELENSPFPGPPRGCGWCHGSFGGRGTCTRCHVHSAVITNNIDSTNPKTYQGF